MTINELLSDYSGNMIYSKGAPHEVKPETRSFPYDVQGMTPSEAQTCLLAAFVYYKSILSRSKDVLFGVFDANGVYRPMAFSCDDHYSRKGFRTYLLEQIGEQSAMSPDALFGLYRQYNIAYEALDLSFSMDGEAHSDAPDRGIINVFLSDGNIVFNYDSVCVSEEEIGRLHRRIAFIASCFTSDGDARLYDTDIIDESEKEFIRRLNDTKSDRELKYIHVYFSEWAARHPDKPFIIDGEDCLTYGEAERKSNQLARRLRDNGCKPNTFVALAIPKNIHFYIALLAIMKSGSAFMPIDIEFPYDRVRFMIDEAKPVVILTDGQISYAVEGETEINVTDGQSDAYDDSVPEIVNKFSDDIALFYTSGTTGMPKGVVNNQLSWANNAIQFMLLFPCKGDEVQMHFGKPTFGFSYNDLIVSMINGLTVVIPSKDEIQDAKLFREFLTRNKIDMLFLTPQFFSMIDATGSRFITLGGGLVTPPIFRKGVEECSCAFSNIFGCTEATSVSINSIPHGSPIPAKPHIGKPSCNIHMYVMLNRRLCGVGMAGELCIAGNSLADRYLNNPKATAEKFEYNEILGEKICHTGDIAMILEDGNFLIVGRMDDMVKIRGIRVEINEVEKVAQRMEGVKGSVVTVKKNKNDNQLCLYFTADRTISVKEMKDFLRKHLPDYMVPSWVMQIDVIPLNRHGKVDKKALPEITGSAEVELKAPETDLQRELLAIFKEVLNVEEIGINSDFFENGGHSLKMTELINKVEELKNIRLSVSEIFRERTVENIAALLETKAAEEEVPFVKVPEMPVYEMSSIEKRMYAVYCSDPSSLIYNEPLVIATTREIDVEKLERAFNAEIARHEIFRTTFAMEDGRFVQHIAKECPISIEIVSNDDTVEDILKDFVKPFDLEKLPMMRVRLVRQSDRTLIITDMHHIYADRGCVSRMLGEMIQLYQGKELPPVQWQYKDYSEWVNKRDISGQKEFWLREYEEEVPKLSLPHKTKSPMRSESGKLLSFAISRELRSKVHAFATANKLTDYMVMLSALMILLQKYSGQEDVVVAMPISTRVHRNCDHIFGMFANTIAVRGRPQRNKSVRAFLSEMKDTLLTAYQNSEYSLDALIEELNLRDGTSLHSLFDVMFVLQDTEDEFGRMQQYGLTELNASKGTSDFELSFDVFSNSEKGYDLQIEYATDYFDESYIVDLADAYQRILDEIPDQCDAPIQEIEVLSEKDRDLILNTFNQQSKYPDSALQTVPELFAEQVKAHADKTAVIACDRTLTYAQLDEESNRIANALITRGVGRGDIVAFLLPRTSALIAVMLGILKAGACYIPLDPDYPKDRIDFMLEDSGAAFMVNEENVAELCEFHDASALAVSVGGDDLCYCIYTSGSTGKPKGTLLTHRNAVNYITPGAHNIMGGIVSPDTGCVLSVTTVGFDIFVTESLLTLCNGLTMLFADETQSRMQSALDELASSHKAEVIQTTSTKMRLLIDSPKYRNYLQYLKVIMLGGEPLNTTLVDQLRGLTDAEIFNVYGPTEATVWATYAHVADTSGIITIGRPVANTQIYIVDERTALVPIGVPGELCIAGDGISKGYLNRPELTAEKFPDNPFGEGKLYHTGDLARWMPDGEIECLGRMDDQVKIRGQRIELGEIEQTIRSQPAVSNAAVIVAPDKNGEKAIFAYLVSDEEVDLSALRNVLRASLPEYMVPSGIMQLEKLPLTPNGKLNKRALPRIDQEEDEYTAPVTKLEDYVLGVWKKTLKKPGIGIHSEYFEVGGNSYNILLILSELKEKGFDVKVKDLQTYTTVESLCREVLSKQDAAAGIIGGAEESSAVELVIEKFDNCVNSVMTYYDDLRWDDYNCIFRPISIIAESYCKDSFDIVTMNNCFYTLYGIDNIFGIEYYDYHVDFMKTFEGFFNTVLHDKLRLKIERHEFANQEALQSIIKEAIDEQYPVMALIDSGELFYTFGYKTDYGIHGLIIKGYDTNKRRYVILDNLQLDNGSGTVYKDFYMEFDNLMHVASLKDDPHAQEYRQPEGDDYVYVIRNTAPRDELHYTAAEELLNHIQLLSEIESGSRFSFYLEEEALRIVYKMSQDFKTGAVVKDGQIVDKEIAKIYTYFKENIYMYEDSTLEEMASSILSYRSFMFERNLNFKNAYFKSLNSLLKKCGVEGAVLDGIRHSEEDVRTAWDVVKDIRLMAAAGEEVSPDEMEAAFSAAREQEGLLRKKIIGCSDLIRAFAAQNDEASSAASEAAKRGFSIDNLGNAGITFDNDDLYFELLPDKRYNIWLNDDIAPKIYKNVTTDDWEVSATFMTHFAPDETHFNDIFVVYLENSSKFLFGVKKDSPNGHFIRLYCPELIGKDHLFVNPDTLNPDFVQIRIRKVSNLLYFEYRNSPEQDWLLAKTIVNKLKVKRVALGTRGWEMIRHTAHFKDVKFSW